MTNEVVDKIDVSIGPTIDVTTEAIGEVTVAMIDDSADSLSLTVDVAPGSDSGMAVVITGDVVDSTGSTAVDKVEFNGREVTASVDAAMIIVDDPTGAITEDTVGSTEPTTEDMIDSTGLETEENGAEG